MIRYYGIGGTPRSLWHPVIINLIYQGLPIQYFSHYNTNTHQEYNITNKYNFVKFGTRLEVQSINGKIQLINNSL